MYSTTITTTKIPISILMPVPLTDVWEPGETLRTLTLVAMNMINQQQQQLLRGYDVKVELVDSQFLGCSMARPFAAVVLVLKLAEIQQVQPDLPPLVEQWPSGTFP